MILLNLKYFSDELSDMQGYIADITAQQWRVNYTNLKMKLKKSKNNRS